MKNILSLVCMMLLAVCISSCGTKYARPDRCVCDMPEAAASNNDKAKDEANSQNSANDEKQTEQANSDAQAQNSTDDKKAAEAEQQPANQAENQNVAVAAAPVAEQQTPKEEVAPETKAIQESIQEAVKEGKKEFTIDFEKLAKQSLFGSNSDKVAEDSYKGLDVVAKFLKDTPNVTVKVEGHTDNIGSQEYNQNLSERRAKSIAKYLIDKGVEEDRVTTEGFGFSKPIASNKTAEGRAKNRRTEMKFTINGTESTEISQEASAAK